MSRTLCTRDPNPNPNYDIRDAELAAKLAAKFVGRYWGHVNGK